MRDAFAKQVELLARDNENIILLSGDIGNRMFDNLKKACPNQFINCGIAESNMISMASGLALSGMRPIVYTITPFITTRCLEQLKIGIGYHKAPAVIVGTGSGLSYAELGPTHHSLEDLSILKSIPDINILATSDKEELKVQLSEAAKSDYPTYIRIGKKGEPDLYKDSSKLGIGKANIIREGNDFLLLGIGPIISEAIEASNELKSKNISLAIVTMGGIRPIDEEFMKNMLKRNFKAWITLEEHGRSGGLGSTILEWLNDNNLDNKIKLKRLGTPLEFINQLGNQQYTRQKLGIDSKGIVKEILKI